MCAYLVRVSIAVVVLLVSAKMCLSGHSHHEDFRSVNENPAELIKSLIGEEAGSNITAGRRPLSSYLLLLYNALEGYEEAYQQNSANFPKIRSYRGLKGGETSVTFSLTNARWNHVNRIEIAIKLDERRRNILSAGQNVTLFVQNGFYGITDYVAQTYDSYLIFDISDLKDVLPGNITIDNVLHTNNEQIRISKRNEPVLLIYEHLQHNPLFNRRQRVRRRTNHMQNLFDSPSGETDSYACRRYDWHMDMSVFGLNWWIEPGYYNAGYCYGRCRFPLTISGTNSTSYSFMKNIWHSQTHFMDEVVPRACCVPVDYEPLQIIYLNSNIEADIMMISDMKVRSCGCR